MRDIYELLFAHLFKKWERESTKTAEENQDGENM